VGELDNDDPLRLRPAFDQLGLAAAADETAAVLLDAGAGERAIGVVGGRIGDLDLGEDIGGHGCSLQVRGANVAVTIVRRQGLCHADGRRGGRAGMEIGKGSTGMQAELLSGPGTVPALTHFFVTASVPCPYVAGRAERKLIVELPEGEAAALYDGLSRGGFRRSH